VTAASPPAPRLTVLGSVNMDLVVRTPRIARPGETVLAGPPTYLPGGKGANQAVVAAGLGMDVVLVARLGDDVFGQRLRDGLRAAGVRLEHVRSLPATASGIAYVAVEDGGENAITVSPGANGALSAADVAAERSALRGARLAVAQLEVPVPAVDRFARLCAEEGVELLLNAAPHHRDLPVSLLERCAYLVVNRDEASALTGIAVTGPETARRALEAAAALGPRHVVVTLGADGCLALSGRQWLEVESFPVHVVDSTGAGDAFVGALAAAVAGGDDFPSALVQAAAAGAVACGHHGAQGGPVTPAAIAALVGDRLSPWAPAGT
jgi:ribokinase